MTASDKITIAEIQCLHHLLAGPYLVIFKFCQ
jgi:hypothetical protein